MTITAQTITNLLTHTGVPNILINGELGIFQGITRESGDGKSFNVKVFVYGYVYDYYMKLSDKDCFDKEEF